MAREVKIFSGTASRYLAEQIAEQYGAPLGNVIVSRFSDGEVSPYFEESVRGCDVFAFSGDLIAVKDSYRKARV